MDKYFWKRREGLLFKKTNSKAELEIWRWSGVDEFLKEIIKLTTGNLKIVDNEIRMNYWNSEIPVFSSASLLHNKMATEDGWGWTVILSCFPSSSLWSIVEVPRIKR